MEVIMKKTSYRFIVDPGHGWLEVPLVKLNKLGIMHEISGYSYRHKNMAYLEEDCDASVFIDAIQGIEDYNFIEVYQENTPIRNYCHFNA